MMSKWVLFGSFWDSLFIWQTNLTMYCCYLCPISLSVRFWPRAGICEVANWIVWTCFLQAGCKIYLKKRKADWLSSLLQSKFFGSCVHHQNNRKNEKNVFCLDCGVAICRHCLISHCIHRRLQICKYVYQYVVRVHDLQNHLDCCNIQVSLQYHLKLCKLLALKSYCYLLLLVQVVTISKVTLLSCFQTATNQNNMFSSIESILVNEKWLPEEQPGSSEFNHKRKSSVIGTLEFFLVNDRVF